MPRAQTSSSGKRAAQRKSPLTRRKKTSNADVDVDVDVDIPPSPPSGTSWWEIEAILEERRDAYLVSWAATDGQTWPPDWIKKTHIRAEDLVESWSGRRGHEDAAPSGPVASGSGSSRGEPVVSTGSGQDLPESGSGPEDDVTESGSAPPPSLPVVAAKLSDPRPLPASPDKSGDLPHHCACCSAPRGIKPERSSPARPPSPEKPGPPPSPPSRLATLRWWIFG